MGKNAKLAVRLHSQEREWLRSLGNGNILEGVRNLIQQVKEKQSTKNDDDDYLNDKSGKSKLWGN